MRNKKEKVLLSSDNTNEVITDKTKLERILIVMEHLEKRGLNSERVIKVYRKIISDGREKTNI